MIIKLGRLTPGYFRLLQRQVAGEVQAPSHDRSVNQIAMMLAIMGLSMSYYSAKQMTEKVRHKPINRGAPEPRGPALLMLYCGGYFFEDLI
ncbi:hypothetical protein DNTS_000405 [Danionella cerebrum]|uniref:Uncharacterized protein n=1 Tax=Danionella cerebrum TaxID=2873325 RepID=A0A553MZF8_9TELE|nr:hypothetical protein DNTS_000405 [Danionella translucida]TRY58564.1 hypothetical protein DNTS_000405 [Danionella translucida]